MSNKKRQKSVYILAFAFLAAGLGYLIFSGLTKDSLYFLTVSEALAMEKEELDQARLFGTVSEQGIDRDTNQLGVRFQLADKENRSQVIWVDYKGVVPDTFKPGVEVIVEGNMLSSKDLFEANSLMTKCPSKYKKENSG